MKIYQQKKYENLFGIEGLSENLLENHFTLYNGYVLNTNNISQILNELLKKGNTNSPEFSELRRRFGWEFNGMRMHEYYFENISKNKKDLSRSSPLFKKINEDFESFENWKKDFKSTGLMRGTGWVVLCLDKLSNKLFNVWINEHDVGHLSGTIPILVMDVFEHSYMTDYNLKRENYIEFFFSLIDWEVVSQRFIKNSK